MTETVLAPHRLLISSAGLISELPAAEPSYAIMFSLGS
jgi:hypothetical protein